MSCFHLTARSPISETIRVFTARVRSTREGNIYTWKCLSVHFWGGGSQVQVQVGVGPRSRSRWGRGVPGPGLGGLPSPRLGGVPGLRSGGVPGLSKGKNF